MDANFGLHRVQPRDRIKDPVLSLTGLTPVKSGIIQGLSQASGKPDVVGQSSLQTFFCFHAKLESRKGNVKSMDEQPNMHLLYEMPIPNHGLLALLMYHLHHQQGHRYIKSIRA
jgi:hypothetical protein